MLDSLASPPLASIVLGLACAMSGQEPDLDSSQPSLSAQGRYVAFSSSASNLVADDTNRVMDVFVRDREASTTTRVSVRSDGTESNGRSQRPRISDDGRWIVFESRASNLVAEDSARFSDVFVHDRGTGRTVRASTGLDGAEGTGDSGSPAIAGGGGLVVFESAANNLVPDDENGKIDVFLFDLNAGSLQLVSGGQEQQANVNCVHPSISGNGRFIVYASEASNIARSPRQADHPFEFHDRSHVFLYDRQEIFTRYVSDIAISEKVRGDFVRPFLSSNGRIVAYDHRNSRQMFSRWLPFATDWKEGRAGSRARSVGKPRLQPGCGGHQRRRVPGRPPQ